MKSEIVKKSKLLMQKCTRENKSPTWELTEIAIKKGIEFSKKYKVNKNLVLTSLYLAHTVLHPDKKNIRQIKHTQFSAKIAERYLKKWKVSEREREIIINAIEAHHGKVKVKSKEAIIMKNAECYKFITVRGSLIYLHTLGLRGIDYEESVKTVLDKMQQKFSIITLPQCKAEARRNKKEILNIFKGIK